MKMLANDNGLLKSKPAWLPAYLLVMARTCFK